MKKTKYISGILMMIVLLFSACSKNDIQKKANDKFIKQKAPVRLVLNKSVQKENSKKYIEDWAGTKGTSKFDSHYTLQTFNHLKKYCGYGKDEFIESRIITHTEYIKEEVWLFNDTKSFRDDKISGITIYSKYNPNTNMTNTNFFGSCHTQKGSSFSEN